MSPDAISVAFDGRYKSRVKLLDGLDRQLPQRLLGAERHVRVRMRAVHDLHERAIGDRRRHVANLHEPRQPKLPDAIEIGRRRAAGRTTQSASSDSAWRANFASAVTVNTVASADTSVSRWAPIRANAALTSIAERLPVPSSIMSRGHRREPFVALEIGGRSDRQHEHERHDRQAPVLGRPERQTIRRRSLWMCGKRNGSGGPTAGRRVRSARAHDTTAGVESGSASDSLPFGTTLSATRLSVRRYCPRRAVQILRP